MASVVVVVGLRRLLVSETDGEAEEIWFSTGLLRTAPGRLPPNDWAPSLAAGMSLVSTTMDAAVVVVAGEGLRPPPIRRLPPRLAATVEEGADVDDASGRIVVEGSLELITGNYVNISLVSYFINLSYKF